MSHPSPPNIQTDHTSAQRAQVTALPNDDGHYEENIPIDPNLTSMYPEQVENAQQTGNRFSYQIDELTQPHALQSLEDIANEVLDIHGGAQGDAQTPIALPSIQEDPGNTMHPHETPGTAPLLNSNSSGDGSRQDDGADSAISIQSTKNQEQNPKLSEDNITVYNHGQPNGHVTFEQAQDDCQVNGNSTSEASPVNEIVPENVPLLQNLADGSEVVDTALTPAEQNGSPLAPTNEVDSLPLDQPPAEASQSPTKSISPAPVPNGTIDTPPPVDAKLNKRKRDSLSGTGSPKDSKKNKTGPPHQRGAHSKTRPANESETVEDKESLELAKLLQKEELGLRRRGRLSSN